MHRAARFSARAVAFTVVEEGETPGDGERARHCGLGPANWRALLAFGGNWDGTAPLPSGSGESVSTVPLAGLSRGQRWSGGAVLGSARTIFSIFFFSRKGAIFFLEEKETGPLQLEVVGVN